MPTGFSGVLSRKAKQSSRRDSLARNAPNPNPKVSHLSLFLDDIWDFAAEMKSPTRYGFDKCIRWDFKVKGDELFTAPKYSQILLATKQLFHSLLKHSQEGPACKPTSVTLWWQKLKPFIVYLVTRPRPILSYDDISHQLITRYIKKLKGKYKPGATLYCHLRSLSILFEYRRKMCNSLRFDPFATGSAGKEAGYNAAYRDQHRTDYIPDEILKDLIGAAIEYTTVWGPHILEASALMVNIRKRFPESTEDTVRYRQRRALKDFEQKRSHNTKSAIRPSLSNLNHLHEARTRLRTACGILIVFVTGIRLSELLSIKAGCIEIENTADGEFIWLHSTIYKIQGIAAGKPGRWLGGPLARRVVAILEQLTKETRVKSRCAHLFVPVTPVAFEKWSGNEPLAQSFCKTYLRDFIDFIGLKDTRGQSYHIHLHMFRRTFARHVVRSDTTNLMALKEHFKHCSVAMTDGYVGIDEELQDLLDNESDLLSLDSFDKALRSTHLSGRRGKEIVTMVDRAISDGRLPLEFRGEAGGHFRKKMIREFIDAGQQIYPCGASNFCWFRQDSADCTDGDKPIVEFCNPPGCANAVIDREEHGSYWQNIVTEGESLLAMKPKGGPYKARLVNITRIAKKIVSDLG